MFHVKTFRLLGIEPRPAREAIASLDCAERRLGIELPEAVRAWYSLPNAIQILDEHSSPDPARHPDEFEIDPFGVDEFVVDPFNLEKPDLRRLLRFKDENQGVCSWSVLLDGSDDPPVYVDIDGDRLVPQADKFSDHVYSCVWDHKRVFHAPFLLRSDVEPLSAEVLGQLRGVFQEDLTTFGWPGDTQLRFMRKNVAIVIENWEVANWYIGAFDAQSLDEVLRLIWNWDDVGQALYDCSPSSLGEQLLARLRSDL